MNHHPINVTGIYKLQVPLVQISVTQNSRRHIRSLPQIHLTLDQNNFVWDPDLNILGVVKVAIKFT